MPTTVTVGSDKLRICLTSPIPDAAITDFKHSLQTRGGLERVPQGIIKTFECYQLHLAYAHFSLLSHLADLEKRW